MFRTKTLIVSGFLVALLAGCKQQLPQKLETPPAFGTVQEVKTASEQKMLIYTQGEDPYKKNWGSAAGYSVRVEGKDYLLHWDQADKFRALKVGDRVNLHPSEYIACIGEADLNPSCTRMMRIYKSERRVDPLERVK